jgi:hypothetical protein
MRAFAARHARPAIVLATIVLPWVAVPSTVDDSNRERPVEAQKDTTIEWATTMELVTADRPKVSSTTKRSDGLRPLSNLPVAGRALNAASSFVWIGWRSGSVGWSGPLALHLAERGPPFSTVD